MEITVILKLLCEGLGCSESLDVANDFMMKFLSDAVNNSRCH